MKNLNPLLDTYNNKYEAPPFDLIEKDHFLPAIKEALKGAEEKITAIKTCQDQANFTNTILAMETCTELVDRISSDYFNLFSINSDDEFKKLAEEFNPLLADFSTQLFTDSALFEKVKTVYLNKDDSDLNPEKFRLLEKTYKAFIRNGALLSDSDKEKLAEIDKKLSLLSPAFSKNVLGATNEWELHITDKKELSGIPENALKAAEYEAKQRKKEGGWVFTLQMPSYIPLITYADNREIRKKIATAAGVKNLEGKFDNRGNVLTIVKLRKERSAILGYETHAHYVLEERMAETPKAVLAFLDDIYKIAFPAAQKELDELKALAKELDGIEDFQSWDSSYYSEKLKQRKFDFDSEELRPYLKCENVVKGIFEVAQKMYGLQFIKTEGAPVYHNEVEVYEVLEKNGSFIGLLYLDLFPRATKQGGAWMNTIRSQGLQFGAVKTPHIIIAGNLTPSTPESPSLLSLNDARTLFHEFGHALHGLLSKVTYTSLASPNVYWDFVELPSQVMENWLMEAETLQLFAKHHETGEVLPGELIEKVKKAQTFNAGLMNIRQLSFGYLDIKWHTTQPSDIETVEVFEDVAMKQCQLLPKTSSCMSPSFGHIFSGGYSAGYYSYKWAEVLDADAFELFKEKGIFDPTVCERFRELLSKGNTVAPMDLYRKFRGKQPDASALLRRDGLI